MVSPLIVSLKKQKNLCGSSIRILSPAKINLYLNIVGKYPNGFHRIESIIERISLCDEISFRVNLKPKIEISSNNKSLETKGNLVVKAAELIKKCYKIPWGLSIKLKKNIPLGSGLGGGSSNAASTILALDVIFDLKLSQATLYKLGAKLGSDVNFFLSQKPFAFVWGRGQRVRPLAVNTKLAHFVIWPGESVSTKEVYTGEKAKLTKFFNNVKILQYALIRGDNQLIKKNIFNVLEKKACRTCRQLDEAKRYLIKEGIFAKVTGSGSALYTMGISSSLGAFRLKVPSSWKVFKTETF